MTTIESTLSTINSTSSPPWNFLGSVSSVSPISSFQDGDALSTTTKSQESYNGTGYYIDDDGESMLNDLKTVVLACVATLVPLVITLVTIFGIRTLWIQYKTRKKTRHFDGVLVRANTSESASKPLHTHLLNDKGSSAETHLDISSETVEICEEASIGSNNRSNNINGSIITMTLKNNHLIVETEERNDLEEDSRETTMRYSPSTRDGVFVVEVQQGLRRSPGSGGPTSISEPERSGSLSDQCALVHNPPEKYSDEETLEEYDDSEYYIESASPERSTPGLSTTANTGLSTSNTSLSSLHQSYCYTTQHSYDQGSYGYSVYMGYLNDSSSGRRIPVDTKPKVTSALYKTNPGRNMKSMSFDVAIGNKDRLRDKLVLGQNSSLDNVLESNGFEEFTCNLYKSKPFMVDNGLNINETVSELDVSDVSNKSDNVDSE